MPSISSGSFSGSRGSTPVGAPPRAASLWPEPESPLPAHLSRAAQSRGGGRSSGRQLILSVLQSGAGVIEIVGLEVTAAISPHQLIV
jgi:hypothetical protein